MYNQIFVTNVVRLFGERNMTKSVLADKAGISVSFLSDVTNGKANQDSASSPRGSDG